MTNTPNEHCICLENNKLTQALCRVHGKNGTPNEHERMVEPQNIQELAGEIWRCIKHDFERKGIELPNTWNGVGLAYGGYARAGEILGRYITTLTTKVREDTISFIATDQGWEESEDRYREHYGLPAKYKKV